MSNYKYMVCDFCKNHENISSVNFPEDLYDLIMKYKVEQLIWLCEECKLKKDQSMVYCLNMSKMHEELKESMEYVKASIQKSGSFQEDGINEKRSLSDIHTDSLSNGFSSDSVVSLDSSSTRSKNNEAVTLLKEILKNEVKICPEHRKKNVRIVTEFVDKLICVLKEQDPYFNALYHKKHETGSSYEGLRIADANEYDIDIVLKFPFNAYKEVEYIQEKSSFAKYKLHENWFMCAASKGMTFLELCAKLSKHFVVNNYLLPEKVRCWMQSAIAKVNITAFESMVNVTKIVLSASGPARTFKIQTTFGYAISLDFVPVIEMQYPEWPEGADKELVESFNIPEDKRFWFLVPKEYAGICEEDVSIHNKHRMWRIHFPAVEKEIIHDKGCVKPVIKLLKLLRDKEGWKLLSSYYLKTVVIQCFIRHREISYWKDDLIYERLLEVLEYLLMCLEKKWISHFLFPNFNLLEKADDVPVKNIFCRLKKIISGMKNDVSKVKEVFCRNNGVKVEYLVSSVCTNDNNQSQIESYESQDFVFIVTKLSVVDEACQSSCT